MTPEVSVSDSRAEYYRYHYDETPASDYGRHVTALRARARRHDPKAERNRSNSRQRAIRQSQKDS
jgi:hypothetical protein